MVDVAALVAPAARDAPTSAPRTASRRAPTCWHRPPGRQRRRPRAPRPLADLLLALPEPVVLPLHPRTRTRLEDAGRLAELRRAEHVHLSPAAGLRRVHGAAPAGRAVLTDSGGVQKEAYLAGVPCVTLRDTTEWVETVETGWNVLVDLDAGAALGALERPLPDSHPPLYGDGRAGARVVEALLRMAS
jgi:UDP-N-acetylglucosamine 2-epimerase (non-hydrolysing)/UDP-GlcNAc3NAcA epimerase